MSTILILTHFLWKVCGEALHSQYPLHYMRGEKLVLVREHEFRRWKMLTRRLDAGAAIARRKPTPPRINRHDSDTHILINELVKASQSDVDLLPLDYMFAPLNLGPGGALTRVSIGVKCTHSLESSL